MVAPIVGIRVYNFVPNDHYNCNIGIIIEKTPTEFVVEYKDKEKVRYNSMEIKYFTLHG
ncbi:MAG: hypothetical protein ACRDB0_04210 [Paraclostridium sp.]